MTECYLFVCLGTALEGNILSRICEPIAFLPNAVFAPEELYPEAPDYGRIELPDITEEENVRHTYMIFHRNKVK